jgi:hypothetical protein
MIYLAKFDEKYVGRTFRDKNSAGSDLVCVGYGDNQGNPYLVGSYDVNNQSNLKTVLLKNAEFLPIQVAN